MTDVFIKTPSGTDRVHEIQKPEKRLFRDAWQLNGPVIEVDMSKARAIWRDKIRTARAPVLKNLDAAYMKALESGDTVLQQDIAVQKQMLRDATEIPEIDQATTPEQLAGVQPIGLLVD
ncbi:hypothetical protein [Terasakiella pusilla]|uniref:hypothetical protein n=1 Tax=Terasakiella pusilla TaxID=64973 RepID=UPI00056E102A|nr:hypothetical protein [Terasakiella pusilla]